MDNFTILVTEYPKKQARILLASRGIIRGTGYVITAGNNDRMKKSTDSTTVDGITRIISQDIFKDRYMQVACLSLNAGTTDMYGVAFNDMEELMNRINDRYDIFANEVLLINIIPWQIYNNSTMPESDADDATTLFRRYGFMDVYGNYDTKAIKTNVPKYVQVRFNNIGSIPFTLNGEIW